MTKGQMIDGIRSGEEELERLQVLKDALYNAAPITIEGVSSIVPPDEYEELLRESEELISSTIDKRIAAIKQRSAELLHEFLEAKESPAPVEEFSDVDLPF